MPQAFYDYDEAQKHKRLWSGPWSKVIWVDDAGDKTLAVIHWMGGTYKVVGRYTSWEIEAARAQAEGCSKKGYCPSAPGDNDAYLTQLRAGNR